MEAGKNLNLFNMRNMKKLLQEKLQTLIFSYFTKVPQVIIVKEKKNVPITDALSVFDTTTNLGIWQDRLIC